MLVDIECYAPNSQSGPLLILCNVQSPLTTLSIVFPTEVDNSKGAPHCLEHLVFLVRG